MFFGTDKEIAFFIVHGLVTSILIGIALYLFHKTKLLDDIYGVRNELSLQCVGLCLALILYGLTVFIFSYLNPPQSESALDLDRIQWLCYYIVSVIMSISIGLISTIYPVQFMKRKQLEMMMTIKTPSNSEQELKENEECLRNSKAMEFVISEYDSFKQFMQYLVKFHILSQIPLNSGSFIFALYTI